MLMTTNYLKDPKGYLILLGNLQSKLNIFLFLLFIIYNFYVFYLYLHDYLNIHEMKKQIMHCKVTMNMRNDVGKVQKET